MGLGAQGRKEGQIQRKALIRKRKENKNALRH